MPHVLLYVTAAWPRGSELDGTYKTITHHRKSVKQEHTQLWQKPTQTREQTQRLRSHPEQLPWPLTLRQEPLCFGGLCGNAAFPARWSLRGGSLQRTFPVLRCRQKQVTRTVRRGSINATLTHQGKCAFASCSRLFLLFAKAVCSRSGSLWVACNHMFLQVLHKDCLAEANKRLSATGWVYAAK